MAKRVKKTKIIKDNLKAFNKEITAFNKRLKNANKKKYIDDRTYKMLLIDKPKKDFYRQTIYTKRQFNNFINDLKKANQKTLKTAKKNYSRLGTELNKLAKTKYERMLLQKEIKKADNLRAKGDEIYKDIIFNINEKNYGKAFTRLQKMELETTNKERIYIENFKKAYKKAFGKNIEKTLKELTPYQIKQLAKVPNVIRQMYDTEYDPFMSDEQRKEYIDNLLKEAGDLEAGEKIDINEIDIDELLNGGF